MDQSLVFILVAIALGAILLFFGVRIVKIAVAIIGFLFAYGLVTEFAPQYGVEATVVGVLAVIIGILAAIVAFSFYKIAVGISIGLFVGNLVYGALVSMALDTTVTLILAVISGIITFVLVHKLKVIEILFAIATALQGASLVIVGALALFDRALVPLLQGNTLQGLLQSSGWWVVVWIALAAVGAFFQIHHYLATRRTSSEQV